MICLHATTCRPRLGHTLLEMLLSLVLLSIVMASVGSAVMFASQAVPDDSSPAGSLLVDAAALSRIAEDLASAQYVIEQTSQAVTVVVPDRTGDGIPDRLRYAWSGRPGDSLFFQLNDASAVVFVEAVEVFNLSYEQASVTATFPGPIERSDSEFLLAQETALIPSNTALNGTTAISQPFEATMGSSAIAYEPTRLEWYTRKSATTDGAIPIAIQDLDANVPIGDDHASVTVQESDLPASVDWHSAVFTATSWLPAGEEKGIVFKPGAGTASRARMYYNALSTPYHVSTDSGASWAQGPGGALLFRLYGYEITQDNETLVSQQHAKSVSISLQSVAEDRSPLSRQVLLMQAPPILTGFAQAGFEVDPVGMDLDADGAADWSHDSGQLSSGSLNHGIWTCDGELTFDDQSVADAQVIQVRARMRSNDTQGPTIYGPYTFNGDDELLPVATQLREDGAGGQELVIYNDMNLATERMVLTGLPDGLVDIELTLMPGQDTVSIRINRGTATSLSLDRIADPGGIEPSVRFGSSGGVAEFGSVDIAVGGSASEGGNSGGGLIELNVGGFGINLF